MTIISRSREATEPIPPLSSAENIAAQELPSLPLASTDNTPTSTPTTNPTSEPITTGVTTEPTTPEISEKLRQHALLMKVALLQLEKAGLCKRYKVLSADRTTVQEIKVVFDPKIWAATLDLR